MTEEKIEQAEEAKTSQPVRRVKRRRKPHPLKGVPRSQWPKKKVEEQAPEGLGFVDGDFDKDTLEAIRKEAAKEARDQRRSEMRRQTYLKMLEEEKAKLDPNEEIVEIMIDVPAMAIVNRMDETGINYNGSTYLYHKKYKVPLSKARDLLHIMHCANRNEGALGNPSRDIKLRTRVDPRASTALTKVLSIGE